MEELPLKKKITIMIAVMAALLYMTINMNMIGTALPAITADMGGVEYSSWIFTIFMLVSSVTGILSGKLSDIYGRRSFLLFGTGALSLGALLCGLTDSVGQLILFRAIQGFGGGMVTASSFATVGDLFSPRERGRWQGFVNMTFGVASFMGPALGGFIIDFADWHWIFFAFLPLGILSFVLLFILYPAVPKQKGESIDYFGSLLLVLIIVPLLIAFTQANGTDWLSLQVLGLLAISLLCLLLFIWIENKIKSPIIPLFMFKKCVFSLSNLVNLSIGFSVFGTSMYAPFFMQGVIGVSAGVSGMVLVSMTLSFVASSIAAGYYITKTGKYKWIGTCGLGLMLIGVVLMTGMTPDTSIINIMIYMMIIGTGNGAALPVFNLSVQNVVDYKYLGVATSSTQLSRQLGGTIGVSIMGGIMAQRLAANEFNNAVESLSFSLLGSFMYAASIIAGALVISLFIKELPLRLSNKDLAESDELPS